ncbi:ubiquitin-conjugating enzyme E2-binding protein [Aspergillus karnatakaensis]|uniref:HECT-type E3 ubiquitin transferase n=1 Tax=Aspergillus karnatakaensis TaxID=1810916 RepID=UPI003CCE26F5
MSSSAEKNDANLAPLTIHAEYLPNIRQISLQISFPADSTPEISLSESRRAVSVSITRPGKTNNDGEVSETIKLPARVSESSRRVLAGARPPAPIQQNGNGEAPRECSYRMQVDDAELMQQRALDEHMDSFVPWPAGDMAPLTKLRCEQCERIVLDMPSAALDSLALDHGSAVESRPVSQSTGWTWKDLPSGNWAEMMDFWHCHKPDPHEEHGAGGTAQHAIEDENSKVKGYGASNQVLATPGTVLVDVATFLVSDVDCKGLRKVTKERPEGSLLPSEEELVCDGCEALIGVEDPVAKGWRLFKTSLSAGTPSTEGVSSDVNWEAHQTELVVAAQLLELIERESARRFIIHCGLEDGLLIWVFNPDMRYSNSSSQHAITAQRAMKCFFQVTANVEELLHPEPGKTSSLSLEELRLPSKTYAFLLRALEASNNKLPRSARTFQENWSVGILHRFERSKRS